MLSVVKSDRKCNRKTSNSNWNSVRCLLKWSNNQEAGKTQEKKKRKENKYWNAININPDIRKWIMDIFLTDGEETLDNRIWFYLKYSVNCMLTTRKFEKTWNKNVTYLKSGDSSVRDNEKRRLVYRTQT